MSKTLSVERWYRPPEMFDAKYDVTMKAWEYYEFTLPHLILDVYYNRYLLCSLFGNVDTVHKISDTEYQIRYYTHDSETPTTKIIGADEILYVKLISVDDMQRNITLVESIIHTFGDEE